MNTCTGVVLDSLNLKDLTSNLYLSKQKSLLSVHTTYDEHSLYTKRPFFITMNENFGLTQFILAHECNFGKRDISPFI